MKRIAVVIVVLAAIGAGVAVLFRHTDTSKHVHELEQILPIVDRGLQQCVFGVVEPDDQLGKMETISVITGAVDYARVYSCVALMRQKLDALPHDDPELASFFTPVPISDTTILHDFGICSEIADARRRARELGATAPAPDCASHLEKLPGTVEPADETYRYRDKLALISTKDGLEHTLRRTSDGVTWDASLPLNTPRMFVSGGSDVFAFSFPDKKEKAHFMTLVGTQWHVGALVALDNVVGFRRTDAGWTILGSESKGPIVLQADAAMDHVTRTVIPALRGRWTYDVKRVALIDKQGHVSAVVISGNGDHVTVEAHRAEDKQPTVIAIPSKAMDPSVHSCRGPTADYIIIDNLAIVASFDGGHSFHLYPDSGMPDAVALACTDAHVFVASMHTFTSCDRDSCRRTPMPAPKGAEAHIDINVRGETPLVFTTYFDVATLSELRDDDLKTTSAWRVPNDGRPPIVRIGELWFAP